MEVFNEQVELGELFQFSSVDAKPSKLTFKLQKVNTQNKNVNCGQLPIC